MPQKVQKKSERGGTRKKMKRGEGKGRKLRNILPGWKPREKERSICHVSHFISKKSIRAFWRRVFHLTIAICTRLSIISVFCFWRFYARLGLELRVNLSESDIGLCSPKMSVVNNLFPMKKQLTLPLKFFFFLIPWYLFRGLIRVN